MRPMMGGSPPRRRSSSALAESPSTRSSSREPTVTVPETGLLNLSEVTVVMRDVGDKETVLGVPAVPDKQAKRQWIAVQKLPELMQRMRWRRGTDESHARQP